MLLLNCSSVKTSKWSFCPVSFIGVDYGYAMNLLLTNCEVHMEKYSDVSSVKTSGHFARYHSLVLIMAM